MLESHSNELLRRSDPGNTLSIASKLTLSNTNDARLHRLIHHRPAESHDRRHDAVDAVCGLLLRRFEIARGIGFDGEKGRMITLLRSLSFITSEQPLRLPFQALVNGDDGLLPILDAWAVGRSAYFDPHPHPIERATFAYRDLFWSGWRHALLCLDDCAKLLDLASR